MIITEVTLGKPTEASDHQRSDHQRRSWDKEEDTILVNGWLNIEKDQPVGTDQKPYAYWQRIADYVNEFLGSRPRRSLNQCKTHWQKMSAAVAKFDACYEQANKQRKTGESEGDVILAAHSIYRSDMKKIFYFEHAWRLLRVESKWRSCCLDGGSSKRARINEQGGYSSASNPDTPSNREMPSSGGVGEDTPSNREMPSSGGVGDRTRVPPPDAKATKAPKRKGTTMPQETSEIFQELTVLDEREADKVQIMREYVRLKGKEIEAKEKAAKAKENSTKYKMLMQLMQLDSLSPQQKIMHDKLYDDLFG